MNDPKQLENEIVDIEKFAKEGKKIPIAEKYRIRIDKLHYVVLTPEMTGSQILSLAHQQPPERFSLYQKLRGGEAKKVEQNQVVNFQEPGVERFMTLPLDQTEGTNVAQEWAEPRRHFSLNEEDHFSLDRLALPWEAVIENNVQRIVVYDFPLPEGYKQTKIDLNIRIERSYPDTQIDMVYFFPAVEKADRGSIRAICTDRFDGKVWQRWSRHRTPQNPWRTGVDNLESHLMLVTEWLSKEVRRG